MFAAPVYCLNYIASLRTQLTDPSRLVAAAAGRRVLGSISHDTTRPGVQEEHTASEEALGTASKEGRPNATAATSLALGRVKRACCVKPFMGMVVSD